MTHDESREMLAALALDALSPEERERVLTHVSACAECQRELGSLREVAGALAYAAPVAPLDAARCDPMRERLVARAAAERRPRGATPPASPPSSAGGDSELIPIRSAEPSPGHEARRPGWLLLAASLVVAAALGGYALTQREEAGRISRQLAAARTESRQLRSELDSNRVAMEQVLGPTVRVVELTSTAERPPAGRMFWNQATDTWTFVAHDLPSLRAGRTYQLWLIDAAEQRISAGTFAPRPNGRAFMQAQYRLRPDSLAMIAVTEEPEGGVAQPTGEIVIAGRASR